MTSDDRLRAELEALERSAPGDLPPRPSLNRRTGWARLWAPAALAVVTGVVVGVVAFEGLGFLRSGGSPGPSNPGSSSPNASPAVACGELAAADCRAAVTAALSAVAGNGMAIRVEVDRGVYCPTPGLLFKITSCPGGGLPPPGGGQWIGHALVTFSGSSVQAYLNIAKNGETVSGALIVLATPTPGPLTGLTEEQAVAIAREAAPQSADFPVYRTEAGPASDFGIAGVDDWYTDVPPDRWVWLIILCEGCGPLSGQGSSVVIDYLDGRVYNVSHWRG